MTVHTAWILQDWDSLSLPQKAICTAITLLGLIGVLVVLVVALTIAAVSLLLKALFNF